MASASGTNLLIVDDEPTVRELLAATLRFAGFAVSSAACGDEALEQAGLHTPDLVLLDVMLPDMDGFEVIRRLREQTKAPVPVPVLFLSARDDPTDKINGLKLGADDYITKPFDPEELIARIHAVLRRSGGPAPSDTLRVADLELDLAGHQAVRADAPIRLSPTEFRLLRYLMVNAGRVVSKRQILNEVWEYHFGGDPSIVDTYISYLRRKVDTTDTKLLHTVHGVGYVLRGPRA